MNRFYEQFKASPVGRPFHQAVTALLDFIYPPMCYGCGEGMTEHTLLCTGCHSRLENQQESRLMAGHGDFNHLDHAPSFDAAFSGWNYSDLIGSLIHQLKYQDRRILAAFFGSRLAEILRPCLHLWPRFSLVPVPLHPVRHRERGYNQSLLLAKAIGEALEIPVSRRIIYRKKQTKTQTQLDVHARQNNVGNAFFIRSEQALEGRNFLLIDDVITTGATVDACAAVLKSAGAEWVGALSLSRPDYGRETSWCRNPD